MVQFTYMPIYKLDNKKLSAIKELGFDKEKQIQNLTEDNLESLFGYQFVDTEVTLHNFRIDTLAFDRENKAFVIIEYKRDKSFSVIDQGYSYLALLLNNKADFVLKYNEKFNSNLKKDDVDWSQSKVIFLANSFTTYQQNAINFRDLPIELWEVKLFDNSTMLYNQLVSSDSNESIKTVTKNKTIASVSKEIKVYTLEDHLNNTSEEIKEVFLKLRDRVLALGGNIEERSKKFYISYRVKNGFLYVHLQRSQIKIHIIVPKTELNDPKGMARDVKDIGHYGVGQTEVVFKTEDDLNYILDLIQQSYNQANKV